MTHSFGVLLSCPDCEQNGAPAAQRAQCQGTHGCSDHNSVCVGRVGVTSWGLKETNLDLEHLALGLRIEDKRRCQGNLLLLPPETNP